MADDRVAILHNPRCTKSRQALALLTTRGLEPKIIEYLKNPPTIEELQALLGMLGLSARQLLRTQETVYKELGLDDLSYSDDQIIRIMLQHPILIQRPIVSYRGKAVIGRPLEAISVLFG